MVGRMIGMIILGEGHRPPWVPGDPRPEGIVHLDTELGPNLSFIPAGVLPCGVKVDRRARNQTFLRQFPDLTCPGCAAHLAAMLLSMEK